MKEKLIIFFKNKYNMLLFIIQALAIVFFALGEVYSLCWSLFFLFESIFIFVFGLKLLNQIKKLKVQVDMMSELPYSKEEINSLKKKENMDLRSTKMIAVFLLIAGSVLFLTFLGGLF